ncbi:MAG: hypothetical protein E5W87_05820, partial [Mesorhizobium sp.]
PTGRLGLDHFEGRSWQGHRHALMTMIAHAFLQRRRLRAGGEKRTAEGPLSQHYPPCEEPFTQPRQSDVLTAALGSRHRRDHLQHHLRRAAADG